MIHLENLLLALTDGVIYLASAKPQYLQMVTNAMQLRYVDPRHPHPNPKCTENPQILSETAGKLCLILQHTRQGLIEVPIRHLDNKHAT